MGTVVLQQAVSATPSWLDLASDLLRTTFMLAAVCALAWFVLRTLAVRGFGKASRGSSRMEVIERLALDAQRSLVLVRIEQRRLVIGVGQGAAPQLVAELEPGKSLADIEAANVSEQLDLLHAAPRRDAAH